MLREKAYSIIFWYRLWSMISSCTTREWISVEWSRSDNNIDRNRLRRWLVPKWSTLNVRVERVFQRLIHLLDKMQVWTASLAFKKESMWRRTQSDKSLILSCSLRRLLCWLLVSTIVVCEGERFAIALSFIFRVL